MIAIFVGFVLGFVLGFLVFVLISRDKYDAFTYAIKQLPKEPETKVTLCSVTDGFWSNLKELNNETFSKGEKDET